MTGVAFEIEGKSGMFGGYADFLCESIPLMIFRPESGDCSIGRIEATAKEFNEKLMNMDDADKKIITETMIDIFTRNGISVNDLIIKLENLKHCSGMELLFSQANYETGLPPSHGKAFLRKRIQSSCENIKLAYNSLGDAMISIADDDEYAVALISHMVLYRSMCNYEEALEILKKRRSNIEVVYKDLIEASIAIFRMCALKLGKYSLDEMQTTYAKMLAGESLFTFYNEKGEAII